MVSQAGRETGTGDGAGSRARAVRAVDGLAPAALLVLGAALLLPGLARMDAVFSTDARYLEIGREMLASGDLLMPTLAGAPHLDKPPLVYWAVAAGYRLLGVTPFAGRLFQVLALLATAGWIHAHARRSLAPATAMVAPVALLTMALAYGAARGASTDVLQLFLLTGALLSLHEASLGRTPKRRLLLAMALLGVAGLVKGPIAALVAAAVWGAHRALGGPRVPVSGSTRALGVAVLLAIGLPWYLWLFGRQEGLLAAMVGEQLLARLGTHGPGHPHGPLYLLGAWLWGTLPWLPLVLVALVRLRPARRRAARDPETLLLWLWAVVPVVFFSIPATKLPTYILPALPPAALLVARALATDRLGGAAGGSALRASGACVALVALVAGAVVVEPRWELLTQRLDPEALATRWLAGVGLLAGGGLAGLLALRRRARPDARQLLALGGAMAIVAVSGFVAVAPALRSFRVPGELAARVPGARLVQLSTFEPSLLFYFGSVERTILAEPPHRLHEPLGAPPGLRLGREEGLALCGTPAPVLVFASRGERARGTGACDVPVWCGPDDCLTANPPALRAVEGS